MFLVSTTPIPARGLLQDYAARPGCHTDCYSLPVASEVDLQQYIAAFFTSPIFRVERILLGLFTGTRTSDKDVDALASGTHDSFALWRVEAREDNQLIMAVGVGPIRIWLMVEPQVGSPSGARLYFGSAMLPREVTASGQAKMSFLFHALYGFHALYSRVLLAAAKWRLRSLISKSAPS